MFKITAFPATHDIRPERKDRVSGRLQTFFHSLSGQIQAHFPWVYNLDRIVGKIEIVGQQYLTMDEEQLTCEVQQLRSNLLDSGLTNKLVVECFAIVREISGRTLGLRHYPSQLMGGLVLLKGKVAEMETGEGKTLTATLSAAAAAMAGIPVHVITVNDYLTSRDAANMTPLYEAVGLSVGCVIHGLSPAEKRRAYQCDICYVTNKEIVFDYLRDRLTVDNRVAPLLLQAEYLHSSGHRSKRVLLRGLHFGIIDEADSILIDEARTPLIISGDEGGDEEKNFLQEALALASELSEKEDFILDSGSRQLQLTESCKERIAIEVANLGSLWKGLVRRESTIQQALSAIHLFHCDDQYLIRDGKVQIIDEFTGRIMEDRSWEKGLHQLIELKEKCELTKRRETLAKISYQRFFRRYLHLAGMSGTAKEVGSELWRVYDLPIVKIKTHQPLIRKQLLSRVFNTQEQKWEAVLERIQLMHEQKRPVLIGTRTVSTSESLSERVAQVGLKHQVLNAKQDEEEAEIISRAGMMNGITIATNMAGRGTDILLADGVRSLGGLHVIITECHEAARIDRQLAGRCGRQGDPGSFEAILSLEDMLLEGKQGGMVSLLLRRMALAFPLFSQVPARLSIYLAQKNVEKYHGRTRKELFRQDQAQGDLLSFSGQLE